MKRLFTIAFLLLAFCGTTFATISYIFDKPQDNSAARWGIQNRPELKPMEVEYYNFLETRISPLKDEETITKCFGPKLDKQPEDRVVPLIINGVTVSGLTPGGIVEKRHIEFYSVGDVGYIQVFYGWDGKSIAGSALYFRTNSAFVPFQSTNDLTRRIEWEKDRFDVLKKKLNDVLPKMTDLGTIEVSTNAPIHVDLGDGKICVIKTQMNMFNGTPENSFSMILWLDTTNTTEQDASYIYRNNLSDTNEATIGFAMAGNYYRLTPTLKKP
jgi:hypothetical protein